MRSFSSSEHGAVIPLLVFAVLSLLAVAALAVDAGNLYVNQIRLQKAVDTGVLAGIGHSILGQTSTGSLSPDEIKARGKQVAAQNISMNRIQLVGEVVPEFDATDQSLRLTARARVPVLLMNLLPFEMIGGTRAASSVEIQTTAKARRADANVELMLDYSGSMLCPTEDDCPCMQASAVKPSDQSLEDFCRGMATGPLKIDRLRAAVKDDFLTLFDDTRDKIGLVLFNIAAVNAPDPALNQSAVIKTNITAGQPQSDTNLCDGFMRAVKGVQTAGLLNTEDMAYVVFSDGAPTAGRMQFSANAPSLPDYPQGSGVKDYTSYAVRWRDADGFVTEKPSLLVQYDSPPFGFGYTSPTPPRQITPAAATDENPGGSCGPYETPTDQSNWTALSDCMPNMGFRVPGEGAWTFGAEYGASVAKPWSSWREQYYNCAIILSDYLRYRKGTVFTVGLGKQAPDTGEPYQNVSDSASRKDIFMARVANDQAYQTQCGEGAPLPPFVFGGSATFNEINSNSSRYGKYFPTSDPAELRKLFRLIGQRILLRLLE